MPGHPKNEFAIEKCKVDRRLREAIETELGHEVYIDKVVKEVNARIDNQILDWKGLPSCLGCAFRKPLKSIYHHRKCEHNICSEYCDIVRSVILEMQKDDQLDKDHELVKEMTLETVSTFKCK